MYVLHYNVKTTLIENERHIHHDVYCGQMATCASVTIGGRGLNGFKIGRCAQNLVCGDHLLVTHAEAMGGGSFQC